MPLFDPVDDDTSGRLIFNCHRRLACFAALGGVPRCVCTAWMTILRFFYSMDESVSVFV